MLFAFSSPDVFPDCPLKERNERGAEKRGAVHQADHHTVVNKYCKYSECSDTGDHNCPLSFCRMAIQVDKFDFENLPQPKEETVPYGNQKQLEEHRQHAQGYQINSKLGLCWNIISFYSSCVL